MKYEEFQRGIERLRREWKNSFGEEKQRILWVRLKDMPDEFMENAVNEFVANRRGAPILNDFLSYYEEFQRGSRAGWTREQSKAYGMIDTLMNAYAAAKWDDEPTRERVLGRIKLLIQYTQGDITKKQFQEGCDFFDKAAGLPIPFAQ